MDKDQTIEQMKLVDMATQHSKKVTVTLPLALYDEIRKFKKDQDLKSESAAIRYILNDYFDSSNTES